MPQQTTTDLYRATQRRSLATALGVRSLWGQIDPAGDWEAQWREMMKDPQTKIGRPRQVYTGATSRDYVPAADR